MPPKIEVLSAARRDIADGFLFYEKQTPGIGAHFKRCIRADIELLKITAGVHECRFQNYHRSLSKQFPFAIYYRIEHSGDEQCIKVHAILDARRNPARTQDRLD